MEVLIGRESESEAIERLINHVSERGAALLVRGAAGIGKSALLTNVREKAHEHGMRELYAIGVQSETHLPFAGLHQLLRPILDDAADLPAPQRDALLAAFGMAPATRGPDVFLIALAVLNLLSNEAAQAPLLVVVDDVQWLDRSSCDVVAFVARRLESDPILLLCALRDGLPSVLTDANLAEMRLEGLDEPAASQLLDAQAVELESMVRTRLIENAAGHPLALIELPKTLHAEGYDGDTPLPALLPLTERLEQVFSFRAAELPPATRSLLLIAAADESGVLAEVRSAADILDRQRACHREGPCPCYRSRADRIRWLHYPISSSTDTFGALPGRERHPAPRGARRPGGYPCGPARPRHLASRRSPCRAGRAGGFRPGRGGRPRNPAGSQRRRCHGAGASGASQ